MSKVSTRAAAQIAEDLAGVGRGGQTAVVTMAAERLGCSPQTVWRAVKRYRGGASRKPRSDRGKTAVAEADIRAVEGIKLQAWRRGGRNLPTHATLDILRARGLINGLSISTANRLMAQRRVTAERGYARFEAARPNDIHHIDFSGSKYFRPVCVDGAWLAEVRPRPVRKDEQIQRGDGGMRLWVLSLIDDHSRVARMQYVLSPGESAMALIPFLQHAWGASPGDGATASVGEFRGLPETILTDNGPAFRSSAVAAMIRAIDQGLRREGLDGIRWTTRSEYDKQTGGKVERPFRTLFSGFELRFLPTHEKARIPISVLNEKLSSWVAGQNARPHPNYKPASCADVWRRSTVRVREVPPDLLSLTFYREERTVTRDGCIKF